MKTTTAVSPVAERLRRERAPQSAPESATAALAEFAARTALADVPASVRTEAKRLILDTIGSMVSATRTEAFPVALAQARIFGRGNEATAAGSPEPVGLLAAAYANGRLANAMDFDETFPAGMHFGVGAVAAALALGEARRQTGAEVLLATIMGYELGGRVANALGPMIHIENGEVTGFPSVWGVAAPVVVAAAAVAAKALEYGAEAFAQAIGLAVSNAPLPAGSQWSGAVDLPNCKYCDAGWCTVTGVFGALSAQHGATGFTRILDGDRGILSMYAADPAGARFLTEELGQRWMLSDLTYKPWPSCRFTHYPMTALARLLARHGIVPSEVQQIVVEAGPLSLSPRFTIETPRTFVSRQFSYPHLVAMMMLDVPPGPRWLDAAMVDDPEAAALRAKVRVAPHPRGAGFAQALERNQIRAMPGGVRMETSRGVFSEETDYALGDPWHPATRFGDREIIEKFLALVDHPGAQSAVEAAMRLEELDTVEPLLTVLRPICTRSNMPASA